MKNIAAVDFDGVLHAYSKGWHDGSIYDGPIEGSARAMRRLKVEGFHVVIFSTRAYPFHPFTGEHQESQAGEMAEWLKAHGIPFDEIWTKPYKPGAVVFIDDRAVRHPPHGFSSFLRRRICDEWSATESELESLGLIEARSEVDI